jgi:hypothetical protein
MVNANPQPAATTRQTGTNNADDAQAAYDRRRAAPAEVKADQVALHADVDRICM